MNNKDAFKCHVMEELLEIKQLFKRATSKLNRLEGAFNSFFYDESKKDSKIKVEITSWNDGNDFTFIEEITLDELNAYYSNKWLPVFKNIELKAKDHWIDTYEFGWTLLPKCPHSEYSVFGEDYDYSNDICISCIISKWCVKTQLGEIEEKYNE
jgi:hypothetical protein